MRCKPTDDIWVWPKDYTSVDLHLRDSLDDEVRVTFGRYLHVNEAGEISPHFSKSASQDIARLRQHLDAMEHWNLWFGADLLGGALVIASDTTAVIVPPTTSGESWELSSRAVVVGCPTGGTFTIWRAHEVLMPQVAPATEYSGPPLPPQEAIDAAVAQHLAT